MLRVTPVYGSKWSAQAQEPECTLIEYGGCSVLMNVGWWEGREFPSLPDHDCLILTASTQQAAGGIALYHRQFPETPIYATFPTVKMGQMMGYDLHAALSLDGVHTPFSLQDVDDVFHRIYSIKYSQAVTINDRISITAHRSGHVLGGAYYILTRLQDDTSVVLTSSYHVARELHLDSTDLLQYASTPDVLVTRAGGPSFRMVPASAKQTLFSQQQRQLVETILSVLRRDGHVLLPVDASGRVLELAWMLSQHWEKHRLGATYNLCWLGCMANNTADFAKSQLEWMNQNMEQTGYHLKSVNICTTTQQVLDMASNPTCVMASGLSLEHGPARDILLAWAENADNAIIFTDSSGCYLRQNINELASFNADNEGMVGETVTQVSEWTTAAQLMSAWCRAQQESREMEDSIPVDLPVPHRAPLAGAELKAFLADEEAARIEAQKRAEEQAMLRQVELAKGELRLDQEDDKMPVAVTAAARPKKKSRFDSELFLKFSKPLHLTFTLWDEPVGIGQIQSSEKYDEKVYEDDYGIAILPEKFNDVVSGVDPSKFASARDDVLRRGLGYGVDEAAKVSEDENDEPEADEEALEAADLSEGKGIIRGRNGRVPQKVFTVPRAIEVLAEISYLPLEGRVDSRAARQSVRALQPRNVIILGGTAEADDHKGIADEVAVLAKAASSFATEQIFTPSDGETVELNIGHAAYAVRIIDTPYEKKVEIEEEEATSEPLEMFEIKVGACSVSLLDCVATGRKVALDGSVVLAPRKRLSDELPSVYLSEGEILLTDLRSELIAQGMKVDFSARQLLVNGKIIVRKDQETGKFEVEGPLCEDFFTVRSALCGQYTTI